MARRRRNPVVVAILEAMLDCARRGEIVDLLVVARNFEGEWFEEFETEDLDDMVLELRSVVIRAQCQANALPPASH